MGAVRLPGSRVAENHVTIQLIRVGEEVHPLLLILALRNIGDRDTIGRGVNQSNLILSEAVPVVI